MKVLSKVIVVLFSIHLILFFIHRIYWRRKLLSMLREMNAKGVVSNERYLALLEHHVPHPLAFRPFPISTVHHLPDAADWPELFRDERYREFETKHSRIRRYLVKAMILLGLLIFAFGALRLSK